MPTPFPLPTYDHLRVQSSSLHVDVSKITAGWFSSFAKYVTSNDANSVADLFAVESYWRDTLVLIWDFRTFIGQHKIEQFLSDRLEFIFDFKVGKIGIGMGIGRLIPQSDGSWRCHCMYTNLEDLQDFPEQIGPLRNAEPSHGVWTEERRKSAAFEDTEPVALIMGGGQSGLEIGARLKMLGISHLIVEKTPRVGDNWRNRYEALCLHDPVFYTPAAKLAGWLESYAEIMELNVRTSTTVTNASFIEQTKDWKVTVQFADGKERIFQRIKHFVFCTGVASGVPNMPSYPGMDAFKGEILHSFHHK
ncbi:hypothetical protein V5O48_011896 [Marasmius crinis-equi]|uniref:FAD/NAD(P)-binding domain-containing protein n=1 Tax=Marasmius crinis-equi TaxID=585013 RepID=A0ABR3F4C0_9AGAR